VEFGETYGTVQKDFQQTKLHKHLMHHAFYWLLLAKTNIRNTAIELTRCSQIEAHHSSMYVRFNLICLSYARSNIHICINSYCYLGHFLLNCPLQSNAPTNIFKMINWFGIDICSMRSHCHICVLATNPMDLKNMRHTTPGPMYLPRCVICRFNALAVFSHSVVSEFRMSTGQMLAFMFSKPWQWMQQRYLWKTRKTRFQ